ncbi:MAG: zinc-ribbon domain-containing protein [Caldilineae bacterium]|nr:MAG: zinc-ribbon domain-containing protein [Caldilineae bacterium]
MKICPVCQTPNPEHVRYCIACATGLPAASVEERNRCPQCGQAVPEGSKFCNHCGAPMAQEQLCAVCHQVLPAGSKFCNHCGAPALGADEAGAAKGLGHDNGSARAGGVVSPTSEATNGRAQPILSQPTYDWMQGQPVLGPNAEAMFGGLQNLMPAPLANKMRAALPSLSGERREVTVLFLDVKNFTAASNRLDSEDIYLIIDTAMRLLVQIVYKYEGTVDKFTGDGLMALFGAPIAHENDPERAVRAALEMQEALQALRQRTLSEHGFDLQARIGINTGLVIAGSLGNDLHMEYTVIGDTVNLASRLETAADPGAILVSFSTYQRTRPLFTYVTLPPKRLKGFPEPVRAYRPLQVRAQPGSVRGLPGLQTPMIGRSRDLARLQAAMDDLIRQGERRITLVTGEAGLGKSRLVSEFRKSVQGSEVAIYQGNCLSYARSQPMWVIADLLRDMVQISDTDPIDFQQRALQDFIAAHGLNLSEVLPYLLHLLGLGQMDAQASQRLQMLDADMLQKQTHAAVRSLLLACAHQPTVLIFEDLHWVDPASRDFLQYFIQTTSNTPFHLIFISRDYERQTSVRPLIETVQQFKHQVEDIRLRALSQEDSHKLIDQLIPQNEPVAERLKEAIIQRAEGNPFYIEEIVRMLIDNEGLQEDDGKLCVTEQASALLHDVPGTLRGLILARFDQLPEDLRQTLQEAAVLGRSFPIRLLEKLHPGNEDRIMEQLAELTQRHFLQEEPFGAERGYAFRHTLIQEAVYSTLLKRDRRQLHSLVAQALEESSFLRPEEQVEVLAYHYAESSQPDKAIPYLISAAESAARRSAYETAGKHHEKALHLMTEHAVMDQGFFFASTRA